MPTRTPELSLALIQTGLHWENADANLQMFDDWLKKVPACTDLIVLPEMFTTGFSMNTSLAESMDGKAMKWLRDNAASRGCVITGSLMMREDDRFYNRLIWMQPDGHFKQYDKRHLFSLSDEPIYFTAGENQLITEWKGWKFMPLICYDLRFPVWSRNVFHYDVLLYVANWPQRRSEAWKTLLRARAIENQCFVAGVNRIGNDGNAVHHSGDSAVIDPVGSCIEERNMEEAVVSVKLSKSGLDEIRIKHPFLNDKDDFAIKP